MTITMQNNGYIFSFRNNAFAFIYYDKHYNKWNASRRGVRIARGELIDVYCKLLIRCYDDIRFIPKIVIDDNNNEDDF